METQDKYNRLKSILKEMGTVAVAFSGGVDSTFLSKAAFDTLKGNAAAFTAVSSSFPRREREESGRLAGLIGIRQFFFESEEADLPAFRDNPPDRCYYCKKELYARLIREAEKAGFKTVADGSNADDTGDFRPGFRALKELSVRSPLKEAGLTKAEIRGLSREMGLPTWNKPAFACLSSRFQYGDPITREKLEKVEKAEDFLKGLGFNVLRVRDHGKTARIETSAEEMARFSDPLFREQVVKRFKALGYAFVSLDLEGYRTGSMNEVL